MSSKQRLYLATNALFLSLSIIAGAFGAHWLKEILTPSKLDSFQTACRYLTMMSIANLFLTIPFVWIEGKKITPVFLSTLGVFLFSFSIFFLVFWKEESAFKTLFGVMTPIGGMLMICAWAQFFIHILRIKCKENT